MAHTKDNERQISQNWPLGSLEWHRKREGREEWKPFELGWSGEWLLLKMDSRRRGWVNGEIII